MKRREFIAGTAALLVSSRRSWAQETPRRIRFLGGRFDAALWPSFLDGLRNTAGRKGITS